MPESSIFDSVAERLERLSALDRLASRGTLRLAMKQAGFEPRAIRRDEIRVVIERILPAELTARGVGDAGSVCQNLAAFAASLPETAGAPAGASPEGIFQRLGGG